MINFLDEHFDVIFLLCAASTLASFAWLALKRTGQSPKFPAAPGAILFEEKTASGRSLKSWFTRLAGASNCLRLVITDAELWVMMPFPFSIFAAQGDLEHRISLRAIRSVTPQSSFLSKSVRISYEGADLRQHVLELRPRHMDRFIEVLRGRGVAINP